MSIVNNYTEQEMSISNKSYTNKDFNTIYPELLDLVKNLTDKWDPTTSNESDPGVVLLKLWAILADKLNYNIDKNILEAFPLSVTLRANAQRLYDMLGYNLHYYRSAVTPINVYYVGSRLGGNSDTQVSSITVPKWTMITNDSGDITYTLIESAVLGTTGIPTEVTAMQGTIMDYEVNGVTTITLDNLDAENRLFFTESMIAENGIFIENRGLATSSTINEWKQVNNLESYDLGKKIFKFGILPNTNSCYVQFPQDIGSLIGSGLSIKYLITAGAAGNIKANELTTVVGELIPYQFQASSIENLASESINSDLIIKNTSATINGADPEDLDSAYKNYKKTVGTFNTLVSPRDYENAIYNFLDNGIYPRVSNVVVSDRTSDINSSVNVVVLDADTVTAELVVDTINTPKLYDVPSGYEVTKDGVEVKLITVIDLLPKMSAFDIGIYALEPMVDIFNTPYYYNRSFSVHSNPDDLLSDKDSLDDDIDDTKSACHDFIKPYLKEDGSVDPTIPYIFKNFYTLTGKVSTYYKVSAREADEIEENIRAALYKAFNARNVEFGQPVKFDDILKVVEMADTRIKNVIINEPEYTFKYLRADDYLGSITTAVNLPESNIESANGVTKALTLDVLYNLLLKMIVSGHVQLYKFNSDIEFEFGLTDLKKIDNIKTITTESKIVADAGAVISSDNVVTAANVANRPVVGSSFNDSDGYKVKANENIQLYAPNFYTKTAYTAFVNYRWDSAPLLDSGGIGYKSNNYYKLVDPIYLRYIDENNTIHNVTLSSGTCIRFVDETKPNAEFRMNEDLGVSYDDKTYMALTQSLQLEIIDINKTTFNSGWLKCLWFTNKVSTTDTDTLTYELFSKNESLYILQDNEYFMYTNNELNELVVLGSGTLIRRTNQNTAALTCTCNISANAVIEYGKSAINDTDWKSLSLTTDPLEIVELQIITLGEGAGIRFNSLTSAEKSDSKPILMSNTPHAISGGLYCEVLNTDVGETNSWTSLATYDNSLSSGLSDNGLYLGWSVISRANVLVGPAVAQSLNTNTSLILNEGTSNAVIISGADGNKEILASSTLAFAGGSQLELTNSTEDTIKLYSYTKSDWPVYIPSAGGNNVSYSRDDAGFVQVEWANSARKAGTNPYIDTANSKVNSGIVDFMFGFSSTLGDKHIMIPLTVANASLINMKVLLGLLSKTGDSVSFSPINTATVELGKVNIAPAGLTPKYSGLKEKGYLKYSGSASSFNCLRVVLTYVGNTTVTGDMSDAELDTINKLLAKIADILYIGKIKVLDTTVDTTGKLKYSDLIVATVEAFDNRMYNDAAFSTTSSPEYSSATGVSTSTDLTEYKIEKRILNHIITEGGKYSMFDWTYTVPNKDLIDTSVNGTANRNNLFGGNCIWDHNHICNKFTIPQLDTVGSSITIASSSLKEERK